MTQAVRWNHRTGGIAGIVFVVLTVVSWIVDQTEFDDADQTAGVIVRDLVNRVDGIEASILLVALASMAGFWFLASTHLRLTAGRPEFASWAAFGGGLAMVTLLLAGSAIKSAAVVGSLSNDPQVAKTLWVLEEGFSDASGPAMIVFMLGVSIVSINRGDPPRWLGWSGIGAAILLVVNSALEMASLAVLSLLWVLVLAVTFTMRSTPSIEEHTPAA